MHSLAIALSDKGYHVTGSDDEIFEPSRSRLQARGLLPQTTGWDPNRITADIDTVILGMHAKADNPELLRASELGINVVSYPEFLYNQTSGKLRVAIAGSHGKTTTTGMVMHALAAAGVDFDYMVGSRIAGFDNTTRLSDTAKVAVFEADEYLSSPIDRRSKFLWYKPQIAVMTGVEWDHMNVFPTFESYTATFDALALTMPDNAGLIWYANDRELYKIAARNHNRLNCSAYDTLPWQADDQHQVTLNIDGKHYRPKVFGNHNFQNMNAARMVCERLGVDSDTFYRAMESFEGAGRRLQKIKEGPTPIFHDFAHAPSKLRATIDAARQMFPSQRITAAYELHTFSSLNADFLPQYKGAADKADQLFVYFNPQVLAHKGMPALDIDMIHKSFCHKNLTVVTDNRQLFDQLAQSWLNGAVTLVMSSGNFGGIDPCEWAENLAAPVENRP